MNKELAAVALEEMAIALALTEKSIASVRRVFRANLRNLAKLGFISDGSILADTRRLVKNAVADAYIAGLEEGGVAAEDMSEDDNLMLIELDAAQQAHVTDFVRAIRDARGDNAAQRDILNNRVDLWANSIESAGQQGLASAAADEMVVWKYGDTDHCETCQRLNGQRHRRKWFASRGYFPRQPGCEALECKGYRCQCELLPVK